MLGRCLLWLPAGGEVGVCWQGPGSSRNADLVVVGCTPIYAYYNITIVLYIAVFHELLVSSWLRTSCLCDMYIV